MHIHEYERYWIIASTIALGAFMAALIAGAIVFGVRVPEPAGFVNPTRLDQTEFANPGLRHMGGNEYEVYMIAQKWAFRPAEIRVPEGSVVTFNITSSDITHGFYIEHHNANMEVIPGHIGQIRVTFDRAGEYRYICHEYCGRGHHLMHAAIVVEDAEDSTAETESVDVAVMNEE